jgi:site-specific DNA recombinase
MKAIILSRVSTNDQQEGHSIGAQKARLKEYCQRKNLTVIKEFEIVESSTQGKRRDFYEMLEFAKKQKEIVAIVADKVDRVQRGFKESVILDELIRQGKIELHFYSEGMIIGKNATSSDILRWDFSIMGAKSYVLNLSDNVKRSIEYKIRNGECIRKAPVGYLNVKNQQGKSDVMVDPERAYLVKKLFIEYAKGTTSFQGLAKKCQEWGLTSNVKNGKPLSHNVIATTIKQPFYYGYMKIKGELHKHKYESLISKELFDKCQDVIVGYKKHNFRQAKNDFVFKGLLKCDVSDRVVSCDLKKGKYTYLICRDPKNPNQKLFVKEGVILDQVKEVFKSLSVPEELFKLLQDHLQNSAKSEREFHKIQITSFEKENSQLQGKCDTLLDMCISKSITRDEYDKKAIELRERQRQINAELKILNDSDEKFGITLTSLISMASKAYEIFESSKINEKRQLIAFMFSNLRMNGTKLVFDLKQPFNLMVNLNSYPEWLPLIEVIRTNYYKETRMVWFEIRNLHKTQANY